MANPPKILSQYFLTTLEQDMEIDGAVVPAGTTVLFAPQTTAHSVRVPGGISLFEAWPSLSKAGHKHYELETIIAGYQNEQIKYLDRVTRLELWAAKEGFAPEDYSAWATDTKTFSLFDYNYDNLVPDMDNLGKIK